MSSAQEEDDPYAQRSYDDYYNARTTSRHQPSRPSTMPRTEGRSAPTPRSNAAAPAPSSSTVPNQRQQRGPARSANVRTIFDEGADEVEAEESGRPEEEEPLFGEGSSGSQARSGIGAGPSGRRRTNNMNGAEDEEDDTDSYYALLNVQKDAGDEEIRDAYRALAIALHPDKHHSPDLKRAAENRFQTVQKAYEVLSDSEKRAVYDHFGARGLGRDWAVVRHSSSGGLRTAAEMREEWERMARTRKAEEMESIVRSKSEFIVDVDATRVFSDMPMDASRMRHYVEREVRRIEAETGAPIKPGAVVEIDVPDEGLARRLASVNMTALKGRHGWETPLTTYTRLLINGRMVSNGTRGTGNMIGTLRTQWNQKLFTEASLGIFRPHIGSLRANYELSKFSYVTVSASSNTLAVPPQLAISLVQRLSQKSSLTGFTTINSGAYTLGAWGAGLSGQEPPNATVGLSSRSGIDHGWSGNVGVSFHNQTIAGEYMRRIALLGGAKVRAGVTLGTRSGLSAFQSIERKVTDHVKLSVGLQFGIPLGSVVLQLRFSRLGQKLAVPIELSRSYRSDLVAGCAVLPCAGLLAAEHLYFRPLRRHKVQERLKSLRTQHADLIVQRKQAAREAVDVLRHNARKRAHAERGSGGVVVLRAYYGKRSEWPALPINSTSTDELFRSTWGETPSQQEVLPVQEDTDECHAWCDVTIPVMMLVQRGQLVIKGGRQKHKLMGFYDPCMGESKHLVVLYLFNGRLHSVTVDDVTQLTAPLRAHVL